jgi:hypothetical protein
MPACARWIWQFSRYDDHVHAFHRPDRPASFVEAECGHCVPIDRVARSHQGHRCLSCLLLVGDHIVEHHQRSVG